MKNLLLPFLPTMVLKLLDIILKEYVLTRAHKRTIKMQQEDAMAHRTKILTLGQGATFRAVATCSCTWAGQDRTDRHLAQEDANRHELDQLRGAAAPAPAAPKK